MPYTLMKGLVWIVLALALGVTIGWLLRSVTAHRQVLRAKTQRADLAELERLRARVTELEPVALERDKSLLEPAERGPVVTAVPATPTAPEPVAAAAVADTADGSDDRTSAAAKALGRSVTLDDLTLIKGIGPNVEMLCHGIGIRTWQELSTTEVSLLRTMLVDAGPRFKTHDPSTWPQQAGLLAAGRWVEFVAFVESTRPTTPVEQPAD